MRNDVLQLQVDNQVGQSKAGIVPDGVADELEGSLKKIWIVSWIFQKGLICLPSDKDPSRWREELEWFACTFRISPELQLLTWVDKGWKPGGDSCRTAPRCRTMWSHLSSLWPSSVRTKRGSPLGPKINLWLSIDIITKCNQPEQEPWWNHWRWQSGPRWDLSLRKTKISRDWVPCWTDQPFLVFVKNFKNRRCHVERLESSDLR